MMLNLGHQSFGRYALGEDETIILSLKAVLACGLILGTVIPSLRGFVAWEFKDDDVLILGPFQDFLTTMNGKKRGRALLKTGWSYFLLPIQLGCAASLFTRNYNAGGHLLLP
jgi:hypothetical protein